MKTKTISALTIITVGVLLTSCRGYEREQDRLDRESEGKGELLKAESTKKVKIEQAKADLESAKLDAQTKVTKANASAEAKLISAKADAAARLMEAESEAKANQMLNASITQNVIEYKKVQRWNGKLSHVSTGQGSGTIISIK